MPGPVFWAIVFLSFASRLNAVTKSDGPDSKHDSPESQEPEEITHTVVPCSCVEIHRCPSLLKELKQPISATSSSMQRLQRFTCGFRGFTPYVCCEDLVTKQNHGPSRDPGNSVLNAHDSAAAADGALDPDIIYYPADSHKPTHRPTSADHYPGYDYASTGTGGARPTTLNSGSGPDPAQTYPTYDGQSDNRPTPRPDGDAYRPSHNTRPAYGITPPASGASDQYDPTEDNIAAVFGTGSSTSGSNDGGYNPNSYDRPATSEGRPPPTKYPGQYGVPDDGTYGSGKIPTTYLPNYGQYDHNRDVPNQFGNTSPPSDPAHGYDPSQDISTVFGKRPTTHKPNNGVYDNTNRNPTGSYLPTKNPLQGYNPSQDISTVFGKRPSTHSPGNTEFENTNSVTPDSYLPTNNPNIGYDSQEDISTAFGKIPSTYSPNYNNYFTGDTTSHGVNSHTSSPGHDLFNPTENFFTTLGKRPSNKPHTNGAFNPINDVTTPFSNQPTKPHVTGEFNPFNDVTTPFSNRPTKPHGNGAFNPFNDVTTPFSNRPTKPHGNGAFNPFNDVTTPFSNRPTKPHGNGAFNPFNDATTPFSNRPTTEHFIRPTYGPLGSVSSTFSFSDTSKHQFNPFNRGNGGHGPSRGISETLVPPPLPTHTSPSHFGGSDYDPTFDIAQTFGNNNHGAPFDSSPATFSNNYPSTTSSHHGPKYDPTHDISSVFHRPTGSTTSAAPDLPLESFYPPDSDYVPKNRTEFKFHLESKAPPGNVTIHLNSAPSHPYFRPKGYYPVNEPPQVTVSYSLQVKNNEMEKKYSDFKDLFFKNFEKVKETQGIKANNFNPFYYYQGNKLSFDSPQMAVDYANQPFEGQNIQFSSIVREPRSTSTKRNTRHTPSDYYPFQPLYYANRYQQPYFFGPSSLPNFDRNSFQKRASALSAPNGEPTETSVDYDNYDDYPDTTNSASDSGSDTEAVGYRFHHRIQDRHISNWFKRGNGKNGKNGKKDDSAIVFPSDDYDGPKHYPHTDRHSGGGQGFWGKVGSFFTGKNRHHDQIPQGGHNYPNYPQYPAWGYNPHGYDNIHPGFQYNTEEAETFTPTFTSNANAPKDVTNAESVPVPSETTPPKEAAVEADPGAVAAVPEAAAVAPPVADVAPVVRADTAVAPAAVAPAGAEGRGAKRALLPENACGVSVDERIVGGKAASVGAYPWIARIGYVRTGSERVLYRCAATLINSVYVVTAAHCVTNLPTGLKMTTIRLGELNEASDPDCDENECAEPVQNFTPAQVSVHAAYDTPQFKNDIGMVRLDRPVTISSYVSPICLPFDGLSAKDFTGMKASVAGWGASSAGVTSSNPALQWVSLTVAPMDRCAATFASRTGVKVGDGQLCAGGVDGKDSCEGDSGGPLMRPEQVDSDSVPRTYLIGIVSFGAKRCGSDNMPGVYTHVGAYMDWILDKIQP